MQQRKAVRARVHRFDATGEIKVGPDSLAGEEPLEVNLDGEQFSVTMRTPGNDVELVSGYLLSEGVITSMADIAEIDFSTGLAPDGSRNYNVAGVRLRPGVWNAAAAPARSVYTSSSCGICGTAAIDAVTKPSAYPLIPLLGVGGDQAAGTGTAPAEGGGPDAEPEARGGGIAVPSDAPHLDEDGDIVFPPLLSPARVGELPDRLREGQAVFEKTGGVHAAALFAVGDDPDAEPELLVTREDVGRHNAVDKVIGWAMAERGLPLSRTVLQVSARASFELVQKSAMAGIPMMSAVSAPSALAFDYGRTSGVTVIGFNRGGRFNVYSHPERIA
ncbi:formate dehydrogenase accessory sulfurtransferase FdhD [Brevibacterium casei]|uniref:Sulfur carrier protein FdhD n=1 Tax=Brevibacterium casei TaxID=33889 RepID=A0A163B339_9MICO|nr:formate dehydrogenase accessory sulfurtransferase FdhD [Brevibacterium casei]NJE67275.1 sulfurtransferase FdhD [Brevibacterium sp. LS14]KZE23479.1 formate dehydrogenase accessory protein FdhD [Brevibacterium casei]MBE4693455.1 sulfurtransferase FdhD [Brevibacterium casei]MBY3576578.1 sulfurtransferase FdhD [Brevibacterium casei]MCT2181493.1 formate dehydrogenase accessory sulfurtransferase FdhD [Brevibacterium casei]